MRKYILTMWAVILVIVVIFTAYIWIFNGGVKEVSGFNQIIITDGGIYNITITQGDTESLKVSSIYAKTAVIDNKLYLKNNRPATYQVTVKDLNYIDLMSNGVGSMEIYNLKLNNLSIKNNARIKLDNITANKLIIDLYYGDIYEGTNLTINNLTIYKKGSFYKTYLNLVNSSIPYTDPSNIY